MKTVRNTTNVTEGDVLTHLAFGPAAIEASEAAGQAELIKSEVLPSDMNGQRESFERLGFVFGSKVEGDPIFTYAKMPPGWRKEPTSHAMWSNILDDKGRVRVEVFYKAAFYDRSAFMRLAHRFEIDLQCADNQVRHVSAKVVDKATGETLYEVARGEGVDPDKACWAWLKENRPNYGDPIASWDGA